jgi:hypothetical protein
MIVRRNIWRRDIFSTQRRGDAEINAGNTIRLLSALPLRLRVSASKSWRQPYDGYGPGREPRGVSRAEDLDPWQAGSIGPREGYSMHA